MSTLTTICEPVIESHTPSSRFTLGDLYFSARLSEIWVQERAAVKKLSEEALTIDGNRSEIISKYRKYGNLESAGLNICPKAVAVLEALLREHPKYLNTGL